MRRISTAIFAGWLCVTLLHISKGQGCSDAGFCTINNFKPHTSDSISATKNQYHFGVFYGSADHSILTIGSYMEYNRQLSEKIGIDAKITMISQRGNNISVVGISDVYFSTNYNLHSTTTITLGTKIPLTNGNKRRNNLSLPMDYQSSLGTVDVIFGIAYKVKKLHFVAAIQQPIIQNSNGFIAEQHPINSPLRTFQSTNKFQRSGDVLLRISYSLSIDEKLKFTPSILPIYHLSNDAYADDAGVEKEIKGSQGLTLNGNAYIDYDINSMNILQFNIGIPFVSRDARPEGLTRSVVLNIEYKIKL